MLFTSYDVRYFTSVIARLWLLIDWLIALLFSSFWQHHSVEKFYSCVRIQVNGLWGIKSFDVLRFLFIHHENFSWVLLLSVQQLDEKLNTTMCTLNHHTVQQVVFYFISFWVILLSEYEPLFMVLREKDLKFFAFISTWT